jgi:hypothetical protein
MEVVKVTDLFKGNQLEELRYWLDNQSPFVDSQNWIKKSTYFSKSCREITVLHNYLIDKARDVFEVHNLLPTVSEIKWYEVSPPTLEHIDFGPESYTILYNYYSEDPISFSHNNSEVILENEEAIAYNGNFPHSRKKTEGISICIAFNYAVPSNPHFVLAEYNGRGNYDYKSMKSEVEVNWL